MINDNSIPRPSPTEQSRETINLLRADQFSGHISRLQEAGRFDNAQFSALYVHVPFCFHKCHYCDFYSLAEPSDPDNDRQAAFVTAITEELRIWATQCKITPQCIFVGGGTPTLLRPDLWQQLGAAIAEHVDLSQLTEWTVEANPETVTDELMQTLVSVGVNRISMGAQSFDPDLLKMLERWHEPANVGKAAAMARKAGIDNINVDLIFAIPGQTMDLLKADLDKALAIDTQHISYYGLTYEPNTAMTQRLRQGQFESAEEDLQATQYEHILSTVEAAGFEQYEISNWAKPGKQCAHNLAYWRSDDWLAVGPSAAGHYAGLRWKNLPHIGQYLASPGDPPVTDVEQLTEEQQRIEKLMMGIRLIDGAPLDVLNAADQNQRITVEQLQSRGLITTDNQRIRLTRSGLLLADEVIAQLT